MKPRRPRAPEPDSSELDRLTPMALPPLPENPLVSVLIGNYNYAQYIAAAIDSVIAQDYQHFEICICDDGSTDSSVAVMQQYAAREPRIKLVVQKNLGQASALNAAWRLASGDLVALLDSDDVWLPSKLARVVQRFRSSPQAGMATHAVRYVRGNLSSFRLQPDRGLDEGWLAPDLLAGLRPRMPPCSALVLRREVADRVFPIDDRFRASADVQLRELAALITRVAALDDPLTLYRIHGKNLVGLPSGPTDLAAIRETLTRIEDAWSDRQRFTFSQHGVMLSSRSWVDKLGAELNLTERLLLGQAIDTPLLAHLSTPWLVWFWRVAFATPRPVAKRLLQMRWDQSRWKTSLKALLRFRRESLTSHEARPTLGIAMNRVGQNK
jgi:glycosyltransferase involved in cell wall biosynthesis